MGLFGSIGKFLFGGSKKTNSADTKSTSNMTSTTSPFAPVMPALNDYIGQTQALYNGGAPMFSDMEQQGYDALRTAASGGGTDAAIAENNKTLSGEYLTPDTNPYLKDIATRVSGIAGANANATFGGRGRSGSGLAGYYNGKAVGDSLTDMYGGAYEAERGRMSSAVGMAPGLEASRYVAPQALIAAGQNISARPYDINSQYGGILSNIARLGGTTNQSGSTTGTQTNSAQNPGLIGGIVNSFSNKLFGNNVSPW